MGNGSTAFLRGSLSRCEELVKNFVDSSSPPRLETSAKRTAALLAGTSALPPTFAQPSKTTGVSQTRAVGGPMKLSQELWGDSWFGTDPIDLGHGLSIRLGDLDEAMPFVSSHYPRCFETDPGLSPFLDETFDERKRQFYRRVADVFVCRRHHHVVGIFIGNPKDWSTYYLRTAALLPEVRGGTAAKTFTALLLRRLAAANVKRVEVDTMPTNLAMVALLNRAGFNITGTCLSERWGALTCFTKYLNKEAESIFLDQFCTGVRYQRKISAPKKGGDHEEALCTKLRVGQQDDANK